MTWLWILLLVCWSLGGFMWIMGLLFVDTFKPRWWHFVLAGPLAWVVFGWAALKRGMRE